MPLIDSHCHLAGAEFVEDLALVVSRAREAGVQKAVCILEAEDAEELQRVPAIRNTWSTVAFATGIHPHHAGKFAGDPPAAHRTVEQALDSSGACALGEIGLDYHYDFAPRDVQQELFRLQLRLANDRQLPIIIHTREATADTFQVIREEGGRGVFHCFTGDERMAQEALSLGFYLSFAGILTFPKAGDLRQVAAGVPLDRLLSETDSPYLAPVPFRGKRNEPAHVVRVVETLAELHGLSRDGMAGQIRGNFAALFG